jgi:gliding motility-associated-like protein
VSQKKNIEDIFKEGFDNFQPKVDPKVWQGVQSQIGSGVAGGTAGTSGFSLAKIASVVLAAAAIGTGIGYYVGSDQKTDPKVTELEEVNSEKNKVIVPTKETLHSKRGEKQTEEEIIENAGLVNQFIEKEEKQKAAVQNDELLSKEERDKNDIEDGESTSSKELENTSTAAIGKEEKKNDGQPSTEEIISTEDTEDERPIELKLLINASPVGGSAPLVVSFTAKHNGQNIYWEFGDDKVSSETKPTHVFNEPGTYTVLATIKDKKGNEKTESIQIEVESTSSVNIPNIFTPNGDGVNDSFEIECTDISDFNVKIYDLEGALMFESNSTEYQWDGATLDGRPAAAGNYYYFVVAKGADGKKYSEKGILRLVR